MGVFDIEDTGKAFVKDARACTSCRECIRHDKFEPNVKLGKIKDHFEFHVESVGILPPKDLVMEAMKVLSDKAKYW